MTSHRWLSAVAAMSLLVSGCAAPAPSAPASSGPDGSSGDPTTSSASPAPAGPPACTDGPSPTPAGTAWWHDRVFYELFVRSFADSDGDGIGDLRGVIERIDYLNDGDPSTTDDLGVTALWLMPVAESPSYHGYDVTDYRAVEPDYGSNQDFKALVAAARARGIEIVVDLVMNHTSREHPWFVASAAGDPAYADWYVWADERPAVSGPGGRPVWHERGGRYYYGYFWDGMPDLDVSDPAVTTELDAIARFWVDEMGAAGFRLDAARHLIEDGPVLDNTPETFAWLQGFRARLQAVDPDALVLGEVWDATSMASRYVRDGALDLAFEFGLAGQFLQAVRNGDASSLRAVQAEVTEAYPPGGYAAFLTNHDQDRTIDELGGDVAGAKSAAVLLLTNPGVPFIYYGEEIGLRGSKPDERIRTPMPWTGEAPGYGFTDGQPWQPMADGVETIDVATQLADPDSLLAYYRALIALRTAHPALGPGGSLIAVDASDPAIHATLRVDPSTGERLLVLANLSDAAIDRPTLDLERGPLCGSPTAQVIFGEGQASAPVVGADGGFQAYSPVAGLGPHEAMVIELGR